jgi:hypothetical protein
MTCKPSRTGTQKGISLVELVLAIVLIGIIGGLGSGFIKDNIDTSTRLDRKALVDVPGRYALERLSRELRGASRSSISLSNDVLSFQRDELNQQLVFSSAEKVLRLRIVGGSDEILADNISSLTIICHGFSAEQPTSTDVPCAAGPGLHTISLALQTGADDTLTTFSTRIGLRN